MDTKTEMEQLQEKILYVRKNGYELLEESEKQKIMSFCEGYKTFLNTCKTERECACWAEQQAKANGFVPFEEKQQLQPGDKVYLTNDNKSILLAVIGKRPISEGVHIVAAHIDSPRLDLKQNPLFEDSSVAYFKTHYYGGIKKYQWLAMPLAIHGVIVKNDGSKVTIQIGEKESDPVFCVSDLLPHLANSQMTEKASKIIEGEKLNVILGTVPVKDEKIKEKVKLNIMKMLYDQYGITEKDFINADIEIVPAFQARDVGLDRSLIGAYGQDDRVCAYTAFQGILETNAPEKTAICYLVDKEEVGSMDNTGMRSKFFENVLAKMCYRSMKDYTDIAVRDALSNSGCLSADVTLALDPNFPNVSEKRNTAYLNQGVSLMKYSGARGKSGTNETSAEFVQKVTKLFDDHQVSWQTCELGKIDEGGGGTVAQYLAVLDMQVIDCGVPLLSMHSPFEISAKYDVYHAFKGYRSYFNQ